MVRPAAYLLSSHSSENPLHYLLTYARYLHLPKLAASLTGRQNSNGPSNRLWRSAVSVHLPAGCPRGPGSETSISRYKVVYYDARSSRCRYPCCRWSTLLLPLPQRARCKRCSRVAKLDHPGWYYLRFSFQNLPSNGGGYFILSIVLVPDPEIDIRSRYSRCGLRITAEPFVLFRPGPLG